MGFKRDKVADNANVTNNNVPLFKYKADLIGNTETNGTKNEQKYLGNFWRSLEMPLIN